MKKLHVVVIISYYYLAKKKHLVVIVNYIIQYFYYQFLEYFLELIFFCWIYSGEIWFTVNAAIPLAKRVTKMEKERVRRRDRC